MLRVLGQRPDGYHQLQTSFKILNWGDDINFEFTDSGESSQIKINGFSHLPQENNLIYKAAELLKPKIKLPCDVEINVTKKIPQGGGLGGGSSNAATTLKVLNESWGCEFTNTELQELALELGADVPVFIFAHDALATGVGELLEKITFPKRHIVLLFPDCEVATAAVFQNSKLKRNQIPVTRAASKLPDSWVNDCLPVVLNNYPEVNRVYQAMSKFWPVYLSGTGSTLFMTFEDMKMAEKAKKMAETICSCHLVYA